MAQEKSNAKPSELEVSKASIGVWDAEIEGLLAFGALIGYIAGREQGKVEQAADII